MKIGAENTSLPAKGGKGKQRMARITAKTLDSLLPNAAASYPRHSHAELIEKGLEALMGNPQPIVYFCAQDPEIQIQTAATLAAFEQRIENNAKAITRAKFADAKDQEAGREAAKALLVLKDDIRKSVKGISEDANQFRNLVATLSPLLPIAEQGLKRWLDFVQDIKKREAAYRSNGEQARADAQNEFAQQILKETSALQEIMRALTPADGPPSP
ncbi:MAG: hypothetical protein QOH01_3132 [Verrucomicrobiota bacterium]|jgi:hypothetical protein